MNMKELRDQSAHFFVAFLPLVLFGVFPNIITGCFAGFLWGLTREVTEEGSPVTISKVRNALGSRLDLAFWSLAGIASGGVVQIVI